jgi:1-acyl-sn-glycerol-3-phosphate acyltransferase
MRLSYRLASMAIRVLVRLFYKVELRGAEHIPTDQSFILAANHQSNLDPPLIAAFVPRELVFVAKEQLFESFFLSTFLRYFNAIPINRAGVDLRAIRCIKGHLSNGRDLLVFPEGTRQPSNKLGKPRSGLGMIASGASTSVLPVLVRGSFQRPGFILGRPRLLIQFCELLSKELYPVVDEKTTGKERKEHYATITHLIFDRIRQSMESYEAHGSADR